MRLNKLRLTNFRNHPDFKYTFDKDIAVFYGPNAIGKTNILESIRFLSLPKSFRAKNDSELINLNSDYARITGNFKKEDGELQAEIFISKKDKKRKTIKINNNVRKISDLIGNFFIVLFCPEDLNLISASPSHRRRYLDIIISQADKNYYREISELKKILSNRNKLLYQIKEGRADSSQLEFWDEKLTMLSKNIFKKRLYLIDFINSKLLRFTGQIGLKGKNLKIKYLSQANSFNFDNFEKEFEKELASKNLEEIKSSRTLLGPHRDDFVLELDGQNAAFFASRGETRGIILALKLCELSFSKEVFNIKPILLLDDIFSELDFEHRRNIINIASDQQTIITTTELELIGKDLVSKAGVLKISKNPAPTCKT
jgi:DNA replication and repair protein RecF